MGVGYHHDLRNPWEEQSHVHVPQHCALDG